MPGAFFKRGARRGGREQRHVDPNDAPPGLFHWSCRAAAEDGPLTVIARPGMTW
jgi:hypothetical protein